MNFILIAIAPLTLVLTVPAQDRDRTAHGGHAFVLVGAGRFAVLADQNSIERDGDAVIMRALQVGADDLVVAGERYWGGWSWWRFDCGAATADRLDFVSVREGGAEGPSVADDAAPYPAAPGGDAAELLIAACNPDFTAGPAAETVADAVRAGREALADASEQVAGG
ncbi:MAG TPA: hypothetical protein VFF48_11440 [Brevundimonas sp.]|nr:hypothetical protein [Brevundimonas sp.]